MDSVGITLLGLGLLLLVAEALLPGSAAAGLLTLGLGSLLLYRADADLAAIWTTSYTLLVFAITALLIAIVVVVAVRAHRRQALAGENELVGQSGYVTAAATATEPAYAQIQGELWQVRAPHALNPGQAVRVQAVHGLCLDVVLIETAGGLPLRASSHPDNGATS